MPALTACNTKPQENGENSSENSSVASSEVISGNTQQNNPELWNTKMMALTFDDGPQECNDELLDILKEKGVKATFFCKAIRL